ncbi:MAG TPA: sortase [Dongiaceae bacterium]|nr:sortase [Dongiaceae bacterium]
MDPNNRQGGDAPNTQDAAANVIRSQIDALYGSNAVAPSQQAHTSVTARVTPVDNASTSDPNPYDRTHSETPQPQADQWKAYHSAWQNYYQQYYEAYYAHQTAQQQATVPAVTQETPQATTPLTANGFFSQQTDAEVTAEELSKDQALFELRQKLLSGVRTRAGKIRRSKHFIPIAASLVVVMVFAFLQYNEVIFATVNAYVSPGSIDPQNIVIDPTAGEAVSQDPRLIIPKINVDVPALYDGVTPDYDSQMAAMQKGVAHFAIAGANSVPGEVGNTVLSGHSSNDLFDPGDYKFIFAQLDKLVVGDTIYANYQGKRYTYVVTKTDVVKPTDVSALVYPTNKPIMTLITCTPLGTSLNRLLVTAEQVSPDPASAQAAPSGSGQTSGDNGNVTIPGASSPTLLEKLFGAH